MAEPAYIGGGSNSIFVTNLSTVAEIIHFMTPKELRQICLLLRRLMSGPLSYADQRKAMSLIISACRKEYRLKSWIHSAARCEMTDFDSMVTSLCEALFDTPNRPGQLSVALNRKSELPCVELFLHFERATRVLIRRQLFRRCGEADPVSLRTRHHILQVLRYEPRIYAYQQNGKTIWVTLAGLPELRPNGLPWSGRELLAILYQLDNDGIGLQELVVSLLRVVADASDHRAAVDFSQLVAVVSQSKQEMADRMLREHSTTSPDDPLKKMQREEAATGVIVELDQKLENMRKSAKFDGYLGNYRQCIILLLDDLVKHGDRDYHWKYLAKGLPEITPVIYREKHRAFDDLAIWAKRRLIEILCDFG